VYGELSIPLLNAPAGQFPGKLDVSIAGRSDWYSDVGRTINPKAGLSWTVVPGLKLRGSWGTSFRAPSFAETGDPNGNQIYAYQIPDPQSPTGISNALLLLGYSPNMRPEKATSWTTGFDFAPRSVPGLTMTATYFQIAYRDRIASTLEDLSQFLSQRDIFGGLIQVPTAAQVSAAYADPHFLNPFGIPSGDIQYLINVETQNLSRQNIRGIDFTIAYTHALMGGTVTADLNGTRLLSLDQRVTSTSPSSDILGTILNPSRLRFRSHIGWSKGGFSGDAFVNYVGAYRNTFVIPEARVSSWTTMDAQIGYRFANASPLKGARIALSATNLTNRKPPYVEYTLPGVTFGYDPSQASAIGRQLSVDLTVEW
jgi:outer membrane receptor protein involved in Fe transport